MEERCRVLIVDDELLIRQGIKHYINWEQEGFSVVGEASNGQEALDLIESTNPHIVLTDMVMPIMDGEELTKMVKSRYPHIEVIIISSFGDFDYVRSTFQSGVVDYILKPKLDAQGLLSTLKKAASRIPGFSPIQTEQQSVLQIISKLISGYEVEYDEAQLQGVLPHPWFRVLGIDLKTHPEKGSTDFISRLKGKWEKGLKEYEINFISHPVLYEQNTMIIVLNYGRENEKNVLEFVEKMASERPEIGCILSEEFTEFSKMSGIMKGELLKLLQYRFYFPEIALLMKTTLPPAPQAGDEFKMERFTDYFQRREFDAAFAYLHKHISAISSCYTKDVFEFKALFGNIIFNMTVLLSNMNYHVTELEKARYSYFQTIDKAESARETVQLLEQFIEEVKACVAVPVYQEDLNLKEIMQYMRDHYAEPLTLKEVAKHFHFNPSYLSSYFSANNDEGFIEYLNKVRIEEATKLLLANSAPISEISSMVGYSDHSYFCKVFKKIKGSSPSQFRRQQILR